MVFLIVIGLRDILVILLMLGYYMLYTRVLLEFTIKKIVMIPRNVIKPNKHWNVTFLEYEGDVINEPNIIIQHSLNVILWFKDYKNVTLWYNLRSSEPNY